MKQKAKTCSQLHKPALGKAHVSLIKKAIRKLHFQKAYLICRKRILHRLKEMGLTGEILDIIKSVYKSQKVSLIYQDKINQFFTTTGLKQGDVLSTILFNIYINDFPGRSLEDSRSLDTISGIP